MVLVGYLGRFGPLTTAWYRSEGAGQPPGVLASGVSASVPLAGVRVRVPRGAGSALAPTTLSVAAAPLTERATTPAETARKTLLVSMIVLTFCFRGGKRIKASEWSSTHSQGCRSSAGSRIS